MTTAGAPGLEFSMILPVLNEEASLERALERVVTGLDEHFSRFEVIVINDGSTDATAEIAEASARADDRIRVLHNERNVNYGVSFARGIEAARGEWISHNGADLPLAPESIAPFVGAFADADVIVAVRADKQAHSPWRRVTSWTNRALLQLLFSPRSKDLNFTQFYRSSVLAALPLVSTSPAFVTPELIIRAERAGYRVVEVEAEFRRREVGQAHFGRPKDISWTLYDMLKLRLSTIVRGWEA
jgi:glycosyltransferase involved in cell wall biosynthesis